MWPRSHHHNCRRACTYIEVAFFLVDAEFIVYDDACHLRKFAGNPTRSSTTEQSKQLASVEMVVDKMHMRGHTDKWCQQHCDAAKFQQLDNVDTEVCKQVFSWLSRYSHITQKMSQHTFLFFILYLCDLHNRREVQKLHRAGFLQHQD